MTDKTPTERRPLRTRLIGLAAITSLLGGTAFAAGVPAQASEKQLSHASGRFLSGVAGGTSFDTIAAIEGESASYPSSPGANKNSLNASVLGQTIPLAFGSSGLQLPDPTGGAVQLGAVAQYAKANKDGSALGASGAVDSNGGIGVAGSDGVPTGGATIDLSGSSALSGITNALANLKLQIGALSARAQQVAVGDRISDPSRTCTNTSYLRVSNADQAGRYKIAGLGLDVTSPLLGGVGTQLVQALNALLTTTNLTTVLTTLLGPLGGAVSITGLPDVQSLVDQVVHLSVAGGSVTLDLTTGALHVDVAALLKFVGLDINNLCPNTSLLPYVVHALTQYLPAAITGITSDLVATLKTALGHVTITVAGLPISASTLANLIASVGTGATTALQNLLNPLADLLTPLLQILSDNLLNIVVNGQDETSSVLTETALQLNLLPGGGSAPLPPLPPIPGTSSVQSSGTKSSIRKAAQIAAARHHSATPSSTPSGSSSTSAPASSGNFANVPHVGTILTAAPDSATVVLNLARATVGPSATVAPPSTPSALPTTALPTGVPAGAAGHPSGGGPGTPLVVALLALLVGTGGYLSLRKRGRFGR